MSRTSALSRRSFLTLAAGVSASLVLAGCEARGEAAEGAPAADAAPATSTPAAVTATSGSGRALVAVFSWSGNTLRLAEAIQTAT